MIEPDIDEALHSEADQLLASGLENVLADYGDVHIIGSYALRLMTWRDLDIHVVRENLDRTPFFQLGARIADILKPHRMHYRDETIGETPGLPAGLYWGVYLGDERAGAWKIDIWATPRSAFELPRLYMEKLAARLSGPSRAARS